MRTVNRSPVNAHCMVALRSLLEVRGDTVHDFRQLGGRAEISEALKLPKRRYAALHVLKTGLICLVVRDVGDCGIAAGSRLYNLSQSLDGYFLFASDVDYFSDRP